MAVAGQVHDHPVPQEQQGWSLHLHLAGQLGRGGGVQLDASALEAQCGQLPGDLRSLLRHEQQLVTLFVNEAVELLGADDFGDPPGEPEHDQQSFLVEVHSEEDGEPAPSVEYLVLVAGESAVEEQGLLGLDLQVVVLLGLEGVNLFPDGDLADILVEVVDILLQLGLEVGLRLPADELLLGRDEPPVVELLFRLGPVPLRHLHLLLAQLRPEDDGQLGGQLLGLLCALEEAFGDLLADPEPLVVGHQLDPVSGLLDGGLGRVLEAELEAGGGLGLVRVLVEEGLVEVGRGLRGDEGGVVLEDGGLLEQAEIVLLERVHRLIAIARMASLKGINWGIAELDDKYLSLFATEKGLQKNILRIPQGRINNSTCNKNDLILDINTEDMAHDEDMLCEIRFHVECKDEEKSKLDYAAELNAEILDKARITSFKGQPLCTIDDISLSVPRGKYSVNFFDKMMRFHGSTFNFNIDYKHFVRCFMLPLPNDMLSLVMQLGKPVLLGKTANHFILMQFKKEVKIEVKTKVKPENVKANPALAEVKEDYEGESHEVFPEVMHGFAGINILLPSTQIKTKEGLHCIKCNLKTHPGWLYFIRKSMLFIQKPTIYIKFDEIAQIEFQRLSMTLNKMFDMKVTLSKTDKKMAPPTFVGIERDHLDQLDEYFKNNGVKVINKTEEKRTVYTKQDIDMEIDDESDGSFQADPNADDSDESESFEDQSKSP